MILLKLSADFPDVADICAGDFEGKLCQQEFVATFVDLQDSGCVTSEGFVRDFNRDCRFLQAGLTRRGSEALRRLDGGASTDRATR